MPENFGEMPLTSKKDDNEGGADDYYKLVEEANKPLDDELDGFFEEVRDEIRGEIIDDANNRIKESEGVIAEANRDIDRMEEGLEPDFEISLEPMQAYEQARKEMINGIWDAIKEDEEFKGIKRSEVGKLVRSKIWERFETTEGQEAQEALELVNKWKENINIKLKEKGGEPKEYIAEDDLREYIIKGRLVSRGNVEYFKKAIREERESSKGRQRDAMAQRALKE